MLAAVGRSVPPSKKSVAVDDVPRAVGKAGSVTSAEPPIVIVAVFVLPADSRANWLAANVPPVSVRLEVKPTLVAALPPIDRMPTFARPPVWLKAVVVLSAALSYRPIMRAASPPPPEAAVMFSEPPLMLNVPLELVFTPSITPRFALAKVVTLPPERL